MSTLRKDHPLGAGIAAAAGAAIGAAIGALLATLLGFALPLGIAIGAAAGGALGAVLGDRTAEARDPRDDLGRFEQIWHTMPYYEDGMEWDDYRPAYAYGIAQYHRGGESRSFQAAEADLERGWPAARGTSRLAWGQARDAVAHVWRWYDEELHKTVHVPPPR
jgi:hypothetical protein